MNSTLDFVTHSNIIVGSKLYQDYLQGNEAISSFFRFPYHKRFDWTEIINQVRLKNHQRQHLAEILSTINKKMENDQPSVIQNIEKIKEQNTFCVLTGQQTSIFLGPLYTIHKALTAIGLCEFLKQKYPDCHFVPIFWCSADDHDFFEISRTNYISDDNAVKELIYETEDSELKPVYELPLPSNIRSLVDHLVTRNDQLSFSEPIKHLLIESLEKSENLSEWFIRLMGKLFGKFGLGLAPSHLPEFRQIAGTVYQAEINDPGYTSQLINESGLKLIQLGYHAQVQREANALNVYYHHDSRRYRMLCQNEKFVIDRTNTVFSKTEIANLIKASPELFSPGVVLRPLIQDLIFPTIAYIAGPGEIAYFSQMKGLYERFNQIMPVIYPRISLTMFEPKIKRLVDKFHLDLNAIIDQYDSLVETIMKDTFPETFDNEFQTARNNINQVLGDLSASLTHLEDGTQQYAKSVFGKIDFQLNQVYEKIFQEHKKKNKIVRQQIDMVKNHLYPNKKLQERVYTIFNYLPQFGFEMIDELYNFIFQEVKESS